jgi:hypothetical protein
MDFYAFRKLVPKVGRELYKSLLVMKLTTVLLLVACFSVHGAVRSQKVNLKAKSLSVEEVFKVIQKQTGYHFFYEKEVLKGLPEVTVHAENADIREVLTNCFKGLPISFYITDNTVGIKKMALQKANVPIVTAPRAIEISGKVTDSVGNPLAGVSVYVKGSKIGTTTDKNGYYELKFPDQQAVIVFAFIGYETKEVPVASTQRINVTLKQQVSDLEQMVVIGYGAQKKESVVAAISQTTGEVLQRAGGVSSIGAALTGNVPGLITTSSTGLPGEEDPQIVIRGMNSWNNASPLILVDGV